MNSITLNLIVIHSQDLEISKGFYETLGIDFSYEQHGNGKKHLSAVLEEMVFEIYPRNNDIDTSAVRLGFRVESVDKVLEDLEKIAVVVLSPARDSQWGRRAVILDPEGYKVELVN